jgi:hypothetical protein
MIHCMTVDGRSILLGDEEQIEATFTNPREDWGPSPIVREQAAKLPELKPEQRRWIRIAYTLTWWGPIERVRTV